jgi:hypothetical protein
VFGLVGAAEGQAPTAGLVGYISDSTHAAIPGATIKVRDIDTNQVRSVQSSETGGYAISALVPGFYEVTVQLAGFKTVRQSAVELEADQTARLEFQLDVGDVEQSVEVTASAPLLNTETSSRGQVITPTEIAEMPLNGRDFNDLAFNVAGVQPAEQNAKGSPYVVNGARADSSNVLIDGLNDQTPRDAGAQARPPLDSLQEFKLQTSGYSAEYGRLAGGVVNMVLKTGTNELHGSLFEFVRNDIFDARNFFDQGKSELRRNQFGGNLSGPIKLPNLYNGHDRTFFLVSWESYRQIQGTNQIGLVPTMLERKGDFSQSVDAQGKPVLIKDPLLTGSCTTSTRTACFQGNIIPDNRISPIARTLMAYVPQPNLGGASNLIVNAVDADDWDNFLFKVEHQVGPRDNLSVRALTRRESSNNPFSGTGLGNFGSTTGNTQELYGLSETRIFTPSLLNELHLGVTRTVSAENSAHQGVNYAAQLGIPGTTTDPQFLGFPKFSITGYETIGDSTSNPIRYSVTNSNYNDAVTWNKGRHAIKFGSDFLRTLYFQPTNSNFNGTFTFNGKTTNNGIADLLLGYASSTSRKIGTVTNHIFQSAFGAFVQDDFRIRPRLTLNLGLRYEISFAPYEKDGYMTNYVPSLGKAIVGSTAKLPNFAAVVASAGLTGVVGVAGDYGLPFALVNTKYRDFAPRLGFAWRIFGNNRTALRGGYGVFYTGSRLSAMRTDITGGFPFSVSQTFTGSTTNPALLTLANPFPDALAKITGVTTTAGYEVNPPSPYLQSWNLTVEHELGQGVVIETGYVGSKGTHLGRKYDINQQIRLPNNAQPDETYPRPYPGFTDIEYYSFGFNSSYEAGTFTLRKNFDRGLFFRANYTYGKSLDDNSGLNYAGSGGYQGAQNSRAPFLERGRSDFDIRHALNLSFAYRIPSARSIFARGWQLAGSGAVYSGQPFTPQYAGPTADLAQATRPDRIANGTLSHPGRNGWFDLNAFVPVPDSAFRFGNSGRNILDGPGSLAINLAFSREFRVAERNRFQFRWEAFNVTNHTDFQLPNSILDKANAGTIIGNKPARIMQLGLRYQF